MNIRKFVWLELGIWLLIIFFAAAGIRYKNYKTEKKLVTYQIFMSDVDGLIVGSPVKFMGVQIGYIDKIKIFFNDVYLKIVITDKNVKLPKGTIATVEFSGMGGSKSLELYPPTQQSSAQDKIIVVNNPVRLSDSLSLLADMFDKINSITVKMSFFAKETGVVDMKNGIDVDGIEDNMNMADKLIKKIRRENGKGSNN